MHGSGGLGTGIALTGRFWAGGDAEPLDDAVVVVDGRGDVVAAGPASAVHVPDGVRWLPGTWVGPGVTDAHVHLAFGAPADLLAGGVVAARDLGAPPGLVAELRARTGPPVVRVAGQLLTAPGGYPSTTWGAGGFAVGVDEPDRAVCAVQRLVADGVDVVKVAVEPAGGLPVPSPAVLAAVVRTAHEAGLRVTAHALTVRAVERVLDAGVDELAHTPVEPLPGPVVHRIAAAGLPVVSTLQTLVGQQHDGDAPAANARALVEAGVPLVYGSDLGNAGTRPGVDPRELDRLAQAGLGRLGALRSATDWSARLLGLPGRVEVGRPASLVALPADPVEQPGAWRTPLAVVTGGRVLVP